MSISIGAIGNVAWDSASSRFKGFLPEVHTGLGSLALKLEQICDTHRPVSGTEEEKARLTVRVLFGPDVPVELVRSISVPWTASSLLTCEAAIPLNQGLGGVAYFGANHPRRRTPGHIVAQEWRLLDEIRARPRAVSPLEAGFQVETLTESCPLTDIERLIALYKACYSDYMIRFTPQTIHAMIRDNVVVIIRNPDGKIVAIGQAEIAEIQTSVGLWRFVEISETATDPEAQGNGLSAHIRTAIIHAVQGERTLVYAESRANHKAVVVSNRKAGLRVVGRLDAHARINSEFADVEQSAQFGDLFVMYLPMASY